MRVKFCEENGIILISERELIKTARRGISQTVPLDENEVDFHEGSRYIKSKLGKIGSPERITHKIEIDGYTFEIITKADSVKGNEITKIFESYFNVHRPKSDEKAQARGEAFIFAYIYAKNNGLSSILINCILVNESSGEFHEYKENVKFEVLERFFFKCVEKITVYARPEIERVTVRAPSMRSLRFPYKSLRESQKEFIETAHRALLHGTTLFATAPTGTGKTVSALYPSIRAMGEGKISKVFYLTPKGTTALAAKECIELFCKQSFTIKAIILTAKDKICTNSNICREKKSECKYLQNNNLVKAARELYDSGIAVVTEKDVRECAKRNLVCPYELSLTYSELCDLVICDFNYLFDTNVYIRRFFDEGGDYAFLIDEAHNLPDRAREMYSAELSLSELYGLSENELVSEHSKLKSATQVAACQFKDVLYPYISEDVYTYDDGRKEAFAHLCEVPEALHLSIRDLYFTLEQALFESYAAHDNEKEVRTRLLRGYAYKIESFYNALCRFSSSYELFIRLDGENITAKVFCIDPSEAIRERLSKGRGAIFFSATLSPLYYYKSVLGNDSTASLLNLPSPFDSSQLSVSIMDKISTRFSEREDTLSAICRVIAASISPKRGNYMIFSPSFEYSERLYAAFRSKYPKLNVLLQRRNMSKQEKEDFLSEFKKDSPSYLIGFCVMGGIYSEGIDLAGNSLIGAIVVGIGMPSLSFEREAIKAYFDEKFDEGKQFAYLYPGMNRVLQAAGRVIRREDDRGIIVLIDDRFSDPVYKKVIPSLWKNMKFISKAEELCETVKRFWSESDS
jgi:DNA excision repair protein ERCC-2